MAAPSLLRGCTTFGLRFEICENFGGFAGGRDFPEVLTKLEKILKKALAGFYVLSKG